MRATQSLSVPAVVGEQLQSAGLQHAACGMQVLAHGLKPLPHVQAPLAQVWPMAVQSLPQLPQLRLSVRTLVSQPVATLPEQLAKLLIWQARPHLVPTHTPVALLADGHATAAGMLQEPAPSQLAPAAPMLLLQLGLTHAFDDGG